MQLRKILGILTIVLFLVSAVIVVMFYLYVVPLSNPEEQMVMLFLLFYVPFVYFINKEYNHKHN